MKRSCVPEPISSTPSWATILKRARGPLTSTHSASTVTVKPGGVAVHTTEFNVSSDEATVEEGGTVIYRRRDIEALVADLRADGHRIDVDYDTGDQPDDRHVDLPPYSDVHLKVELARYVVTSIGLIIEHGPKPPLLPLAPSATPRSS